jgi:hypothetical protein
MRPAIEKRFIVREFNEQLKQATHSYFFNGLNYILKEVSDERYEKVQC